jgi:hypothetical protein
MEHGGLFDGPAERYDACYAKHAAHRLERGQSRHGDSNKTNALTIAEWMYGLRFARRMLRSKIYRVGGYCLPFSRDLYIALRDKLAANVIFPRSMVAVM